ncbi:MAG TPA: stage III sporulation protein AG [Clostridiales bacterium]|nr:stage III sporulation protein AG [Clostridiales bacterium]
MEIASKIIGRIKEWIARQDRKKLIENTAIVIIIGVIIIIAGSSILAPKNRREDAPVPETLKPEADSVPANGMNAVKEADVEARLKSILSQIEGAGKVDVMITWSATEELVPAYDIKRSQEETEEKDSAGGTRKIKGEEYESTVAYEELSSGVRSPVILKKLKPEIRGVLVVAEGADSVEVRERITRAVAVVLDISANRVQVVQRKK